jgi:hypothetical protein
LGIKIERRLDIFKLDLPMLHQIMDIFLNELEKGLNTMTNPVADLKMYPTYVFELPSGKEFGDILALDLGGSNFRVVLIRLKAYSKPVIENKAFILSESLMKGSGEKVILFRFFGFLNIFIVNLKLFDHIASCLAQFMKCQNLDLNQIYSLGFTFSYVFFLQKDPLLLFYYFLDFHVFKRVYRRQYLDDGRNVLVVQILLIGILLVCFKHQLKNVVYVFLFYLKTKTIYNFLTCSCRIFMLMLLLL